MGIIRNVYKYLRFWGGEYRCNICSRRVKTFFPLSTDLQQKAKSNDFSYDFKRMETLNYDLCNCPFCLSSDRERLYWIFLAKYLTNSNKKYSVLDFAPSMAFSKKIRATNHNYVSTDLYRNDVDIKMDICDMKEIIDSSFDFIICSHVLEHVPSPEKALKEIFRVMRADAKAIIMVPLFWDVKATIEDPTHNTDELRLKYYGQDDHVRLFARHDFLDRLKNAGFHIDELRPSDFEEKEVRENAISDNSILYVCTKTQISNFV